MCVFCRIHKEERTDQTNAFTIVCNISNFVLHTYNCLLYYTVRLQHNVHMYIYIHCAVLLCTFVGEKHFVSYHLILKCK